MARSKKSKSNHKKYDNRKKEFKSSRICDQGNDFSWYTKGNSLTESAANFFLTQPAGVSIGTQKNNGTVLSEPGILVIKMLPSINPTGLDESHAVVSGINVGAREFYADIRKHNSGARGLYSASDVMMYMIAVENAYSFLQSAQRVYGYLDKYPSENRFYSKRLVEAMGWDYDDIIDQRVQFFTWINTCIERMKRFVIPTGYSSLNRTLWINSNVWVDNPNSIKSAIYVPKYDGYFKFDATTFSQGGGLVISDVPDKFTLATAKQYFEDLFEPINGDDDFLTLTGDIMKAYGDDIYKMSIIPMDYTISPLYDMHALEQVLNLTVVPGFKNTDMSEYSKENLPWIPEWMRLDMVNFGNTYCILQQDDVIYFNPMTYGTEEILLQIASGFNDKVYINTPLPNPNAETVVEATRLITKVNQAYATPDVDLYPVLTCGNEIVVGLVMYYNDDERNVNAFNSLEDLDILNITAVSSLRQFAYAPVTGWFTAIDELSSYGLSIDSYNVGYTDVPSFYNLNDVITLAMHTRK